eukprot:2234521-Heterocapsa_arctica.AAC.1
MSLEERHDGTIFPISTITRLLDEYGSTMSNGRSSDLFESIPKLIPQFPVALDLGNGGGAAGQ